MKNYILNFVALVVSILVFSVAVFASELGWQDISRGSLNFKRVLVDRNNPSTIYSGTNKEILKTEDAGINWKSVLFVKGQNSSVNFLTFDPRDAGSIYASTGNGLFRTLNQGKGWEKVFKGKNYLENQATVSLVLPSDIYLGTKKGLFVSKDKARSWHKEKGILGNSHILAITSNLKDPAYIYVVCSEGVFRTKDNGQSWQKIFVVFPVEKDGADDSGQEFGDHDEEESFSSVRYICINPHNPAYLYLATSQGVYESQDQGEKWSLLSDYGLLSHDVKYLLFSQGSNLCAITESGIFEYRDGRWWELSLRLPVGTINHLAVDEQGNLFAACDKGLFKTKLKDSANNGRGGFAEPYYEKQPSIEEVHQAAIEYAEVSQGKIKLWRRQAAKKAWLPKVSCGVNRDVVDLWHWETGSTTKSDDDALQKGRDSLEWDINFSWDFGELIWNNDQTSIDVRSRLLVELRNDILDEVTKLYFERLRVKLEIDKLSIEEKNKRIEKELRVRELDASLDALTGGYFSRNLKNKS